MQNRLLIILSEKQFFKTINFDQKSYFSEKRDEINPASTCLHPETLSTESLNVSASFKKQIRHRKAPQKKLQRFENFRFFENFEKKFCFFIFFSESIY